MHSLLRSLLYIVMVVAVLVAYHWLSIRILCWYRLRRLRRYMPAEDEG